MNNKYLTQGWTLVELMVTVAIIGLLASIAIPSYNGYISTSQTGVARANAETLAGFEDTYFYETGAYWPGTYDPSAGTDTLTVALGWNPSSDKDNFKYVITVATCGGQPCYTLVVTSLDDATINATVNKP